MHCNLINFNVPSIKINYKQNKNPNKLHYDRGNVIRARLLWNKDNKSPLAFPFREGRKFFPEIGFAVIIEACTLSHKWL